MVAVFTYQMIGIPIVIYWLNLHELSDLERIQAGSSHVYW
jgi:hypothetical protein